MPDPDPTDPTAGGDRGGPTFDRALADLPEIAEALDALHEAARAAVDHDLLEPCRLRIAMLLGAPLTTADWPSAARFDRRQRACLAYAEHHVLDVASMPAAVVDELDAALGHDALLDFVNALLVIEQRIRLSLAWDRLRDGEAA